MSVGEQFGLGEIRVLGDLVQDAKRRLMEELPVHQRATRRQWGSSPATTFEDHARESGDPFTRELLGRFHRRLNVLLTRAIDSGEVERAVHGWMKRRRGNRLSHDEAMSAGLEAARQACVDYDPVEVENFRGYVGSAVARVLDRESTRVGTAVEIPDSIAEGRKGAAEVPKMESFDDVFAQSVVEAEESHRVNTEETDVYWRQFFGYND